MFRALGWLLGSHCLYSSWMRFNNQPSFSFVALKMLLRFLKIWVPACKRTFHHDFSDKWNRKAVLKYSAISKYKTRDLRLSVIHESLAERFVWCISHLASLLLKSQEGAALNLVQNCKFYIDAFWLNSERLSVKQRSALWPHGSADWSWAPTDPTHVISLGKHT